MAKRMSSAARLAQKQAEAEAAAKEKAEKKKAKESASDSADSETTTTTTTTTTTKRTAKPSTTAATAATRLKLVWKVFNASFKEVATFKHTEKDEAEALAAKMKEDSGKHHFVNAARVPLDED